MLHSLHALYDRIWEKLPKSGSVNSGDDLKTPLIVPSSTLKDPFNFLERSRIALPNPNILWNDLFNVRFFVGYMTCKTGWSNKFFPTPGKWCIKGIPKVSKSSGFPIPECCNKYGVPYNQ